MNHDTSVETDRRPIPRRAVSNPGGGWHRDRPIEPSADTLDAYRPASIEDHIEAAVERAVSRILGPHLRKLSGPEPVVFTIGQVAGLMQVSEDTVGRLVKRGVLPRVPHLDGKVLIPRDAVERLTRSEDQPGAVVTKLPPRALSIRSAAWRSEAGMK